MSQLRRRKKATANDVGKGAYAPPKLGATQRVPRTQCYTLAPREYDVQSLREFARLHAPKRAAFGVHSSAGAGVQPLVAAGGPAAGGARGGGGGAGGAG